MFHHYYKEDSGQNGRKLTWNHQFSRGDIQLLYLDRKYDLNVSIRQATLLLAYENTDYYSEEEIMRVCGGSTDDVTKLMKSFVDLGILLENRTGNAVGFSLNFKFTHKNTKLKLPLLLSSSTKDEDDTNLKSLEDDRRFYIQAVIVRIMKAKMLLSHEALIEEVILESRPRFIPTVGLIKRCIESLIEKQFIDRAAHKNQYVYIS
jgi:cullin 2